MNAAKPKISFPYIATVIAFTAIVIMLGLGFWQLERKIEKEDRIASIKNAEQSGNISMETAFSDVSAYQDFIVNAEGKALEKYFYIDNKLLNGRAGYYVLVPYDTPSGLLMLNLGWLPATGLRADMPTFQIPLLDSAKGILHLPTKNSLVTETNNHYGSFPVLLQQVDMVEISKHLGRAVLPAVLRLVPEQSEFERNWKAVIMSPEKHLAYAIQWFGLAIAALTIYLLSVVKWMNGPLPTGKNK